MKSGTLPSGDRQLSVPPLVHLEGQRCGALGGGSPEGGVCDSLLHSSSSVSDSHPSWIRTLPGPSRGELWRRRFRHFTAREQWSLRLRLQAFTAAHLLSPTLRGGGGGDYRSVHPEPECGSDSFSNGDFSDSPSFCVEERLDGLHRCEGSLSSDHDPPCVPQISQVHSRREDLAVPGPLLWSVPTGFHSRDGSCVGVPPSAGSSDASVSRRLADPCVVLGGSLLGKGSLSLCQELGIVVNLEKSTLTPSQQITYLGIRINSDFPGFGDSLEDRKVLLNSRRISVLKGAVCEVLGHLASLSRLVPNGQFRMRALQLALSRGWDFWDEEVLVPWDPPSRDDLRWWCTEGHLDEGISLALRSPDQMFWSDASNHGWGGDGRRPLRLGCLAGGRGLSFDQSSRAVGRGERSQGSLYLFGRSGCRSLLRQHDRGGVSEEARGDLVSGPERCCPTHSALGGAVEHRPDASVCSREEQRGGGCSVSPQPGNRLGVGAPSGGVQLAPRALAGDNRSFCLLNQSPLFCLFCSYVGSHGCGYGCHAPVMGFATGVCLPSLRHDWPGPGEGEGLPESGAHARRSLLALTSVVSGAARAADSASSSSSISVGSSASATRQKVPSEPVHASSSCVEPLRRFARASGFSRSVARRLGQARRQSSVANYQSKWLNVPSLVLRQGSFGVQSLSFEGCGLPCLALGGSGFIAVFGQDPPLYAVFCLSF